MASDDLLAKREKIQREILALESSLGADSSIIDLLSSDSNSDDESDDSVPVIEGLHDDLETERQRIQREIEELENTLGANAALANVLQDSEHGTDSSDEDSDGDDELNLPQNVETCLQMNLVYQEVLKEKLSELERLLKENQQQQKEIKAQLSGPSTSSSSAQGLPSQKLFLGYFMKPYFKDKLTSLGPPSNPETKERLSHGTRPIDELKIRRWEGWQKTLLSNAVATDIMKRMLQPKLSKLEYLSAKMSRVEAEGKEELKKQIELIEQEIAKISTLKDDQLVGKQHDDHDWEKISNIDFEGLRRADDLKRFWQNFLHPSINKSVWKQDEIDQLKGIVEEFNCCHWDKIAEALGTNRTAFMCFQTYQRYISKTFRRKEWTPEEDQILKDLVEKMRIGNFIPYIQMSYFMVGRDGSQLSYRWSSVLDPSLKKGHWSKEEDQMLRNAVAKYGTREWGKIRVEVPGRTDGACRDRYLDCLQENVKKGPWSKEEVELLKQKVEKYGVGKWSKIASEIPNRVDCQCLNKWKLMTKPSQNKGTKREMKQTTGQQTAKRRKVLRKIRMEICSSSEDEKSLKYMDSDDEQDPPLVEDVEIPRKHYVQPDMKKWIPTNTLLLPQGTLRTAWVRLPTDEEELQESTKESGLGRIRSEESKCPKVRSILVRNTILNRFGYMERTYVGMNPVVLQRQTDDEKAMIKVAGIDIKLFMQWKGALSPGNKKKVQGCPGNKKKRRMVQDMFSLKNDLLKAITPWIGNVILPPPDNTFCEGDIVGIKAADIPLQKTSVLLFFIKAFHIDVMGCRKVIGIQQKISIEKPIAISKPRTDPPKTVAAMLQEANQKAEHKKPAEPPQHSPPLQPVHHLDPPQLPDRQMMPPALIHPNNIVITQPNMQEAVQPLMLKGQKISLLPQSPPQAISPIPLPLLQQTPPAQPITTSTSQSPSVEDSNSIQSMKRIRKPTEKVQAQMEEAKVKSTKKEPPKQKKSKNVALPTITLQAQPVNWILSPTGLVQVTGPLSANIPSNQMLNVPNNSLLNNSIRPYTLTNLYPSSSALVVASSSVNPGLISSSVSYASSFTQKTSSSMNISPRGNNSCIQMPPSTTTSLVLNQSMLSQAPTKVDQGGSHVESTKNSSDSSSDETIVRQCQSSPSTGPSASHAVASILPVPLTVPAFASGPTNEVVKPCGVSENGCFPVRTSQLPTVIQQKSLPVTRSRPICASRRHLQRLAPAPQIVAPSFHVVAPSPQFVAPSFHFVAPSPHVVAPSLRIVAPSPLVAAPSVVPQFTTSNDPLIPIPPDPPSDGVSFDPHLIFPEQSSEVEDWINGKGGIPIPHLEMSLPYLPPSAASIKTLTSLLKAKQSLLTTAVKSLPVEYQNDMGEEAQVAAIRKMIAERFASNPAYLLFKARFLSCFTLPALLATINPSENEKCESSTDNNDDEEEELPLLQRGKRVHPPVAKIELNMNENEASAKQFSGIIT
ncbi:snRNA-activating protein complex subunit 4 [Rhinichthys klamathensis goyatoka]|uniref:snRNA-activating protein complex subunit 4 n=1 Tax=Rhinichthys klamathensis goyatoka TaxID=3034132 RepID=UPI0024B505EB|nr:snRNA-activating protein complex subunit 4 [Rhinichthys klamathensis goyatoka]